MHVFKSITQNGPHHQPIHEAFRKDIAIQDFSVLELKHN